MRRLSRRRANVPQLTVTRRSSAVWRIAALLLAAAAGAGAMFAWSRAYTVPIADAANDAELRLSQARAEMDRLRQQLEAETSERGRLQGIANAADSRVKIEVATAERLTQQLKTLEAENARLKADIVYFEALLPATGTEGRMEIRSLQVVPDAQPNNHRYRALLLLGGRDERRFDGQLQLLVTLTLGGKTTTLVLPKRGAAEPRDQMRVSFTRFRRVEGRFEVPAGAIVKSVQLRVLEKGAVRAQQTITM